MIMRSILGIVYGSAVVLILLVGAASSEQTPELMGVGFGFAYPSNNLFHWLDYLGPSFVRTFFHPFIDSNSPANNTAHWKAFASNSWSSERAEKYGDQYGVSFSGEEVNSRDAYVRAVEDLRSRMRSKGPSMGVTQFLKDTHPAVLWEQLMWPMERSAIGITLMQQGIPEEYLKKLRGANIDVMAVWDLDCRELPFESVDASSPIYYKERFENYRLMYIGSVWMAEQGITKIELYNEPDKDADCMDAERWRDDVRIKSDAVQNAFADVMPERQPELIAPATAASFSTNYGSEIFNYMHVPFLADGPDENWRLFDSYSYHAYNRVPSGCTTISSTCMPESGHKMRTKYENAKQKISDRGYADMDVHISEFNCFTYKTTENLAHMHVMDHPATAACIGSQIASLFVRNLIPKSMSLHKIAQNRVTSVDSKVGKNGVLYGHTTGVPFDVSGATKSFEVYRMILSKILPGRRNIIQLNSPSHTFKFVNDLVTAWGVKHVDDKILCIFFANQGDAADVVIDIAPYGALPNSVLSMSTVSAQYHGEVSQLLPVKYNSTVTFSIPGESFIEMKIPLIPSKKVILEASHATAMTPSKSFKDGMDFKVSMDPKHGEPSVIAVGFSGQQVPEASKILRAILEMHLSQNNREEPTQDQMVTVIGFNDWVDGMNWQSSGILKKNPSSSIQDSRDNVIDWNDKVTIVGHIVVPDAKVITEQGGRTIRLDVSDAIRKGIRSFALVRMIRFDETGNDAGRLPQDKPEGRYIFSALSDPNTAWRPRLVIDEQDFSQPVEPFPPQPSPPPPADNIPSPPPPKTCSYSRGYYKIKAASCGNLYLTHSLKSSNTKLYLRSKNSAKAPRSVWKINKTISADTPTTIFALGRKSKYSYLATGRAPRLGKKTDVMRIAPAVPGACERVRFVSHARARKGLRAYLRVDPGCQTISWSYSKYIQDGSGDFVLSPTTVN